MSDLGVEHAHQNEGSEHEGFRLVVYVPGGEPVPVYVKDAGKDEYTYAGSLQTRRGAPFIGDDLQRVDGRLLVLDTLRSLGVPVYGGVESFNTNEEEIARALQPGYWDLLDCVDQAVPGLHVGPGSMLGA